MYSFLYLVECANIQQSFYSGDLCEKGDERGDETTDEVDDQGYAKEKGVSVE